MLKAEPSGVVGPWRADPILSAALSLSTRGVAIHWLKPRTKRPVMDEWPTAPVATPESLKASYRKGFNVGVRPGEPSCVEGLFLHVLDVDVRDETKAAEAYAWLDENFREWRTFPTVASGSGGSSLHIYFFLDKPYRSRMCARSTEHCTYRERKVWCWQIEVYGTGNNIVVPPSIHPDTGEDYKWIRPLDFDLIELGCAPKLTAERIQSWHPEVESTKSEPNDNRLGHSVEEVKDILAKLPFDEWVEDRNGWVRCGLAIHHELGAEDGYEVWCNWAAQSDKFDEDDSRRVWRSFSGNTATPVRIATLKAAVRAVEIAEMFDDVDDEGGGDADALAEHSTETTEKVTKTAAGDLDAGQRFARAYHYRFLHIYSDKRWLHWPGIRWEDCRKGEEVEAAKILAKRMLPAAALAVSKNPNEKNKAHLAYALRLNRDGSRLHAVLGMARSVAGMANARDSDSVRRSDEPTS